MSLFSRTKDRVVEQLALAYLNTKLLSPYGRATELRIDSRAKRILLQVELKGETTPVEVEITEYQILSAEKRYSVQIGGVRTSREWLTVLAATYVRNVPWELPPQVARILMRTI